MITPTSIQLALLAFECLTIAVVVLIMMRLRTRFGLAPLFVFLGSNQYLQTILAANIFVEVPGGALVSPGSISLFGGGLFAILLIYVQESVQTTRNLIFAVVIANLTLTGLSTFTAVQVELDGAQNLGAIPLAVFQLNARVFLSGTFVLVLDCLALVVGYESLNRLPQVPLALRVWLVLAGILAMDTVLFNLLSFGPGVLSTLPAQVGWKCAAATLYALVFAGTLRGTGTHESREVWSIVAWQTRVDEMEREHEKNLLAMIESLEQRVEERTRELKNSEHRYRVVHDLSPEAILVEGSSPPLWNASAKRLFGGTPRGSLAELVHPDDRQNYADLLAAVDGTRRKQLRMTTLDGEAFVGEISLQKIPGGREAVAIVRDVSESEERAKAKNDFIAMMNHDIRTPLASLKGALALLASGSMSGADGQALLEVGSRNVERLIRLTSDLLELQRLDAHGVPLRLERLDAQAICARAVSGMTGLAIESKITLSVKGEPAAVFADADRLEQVLVNLLSNAISHSDAGGSVELRVAVVESRVSIQCIDQGSGIPLSQQEQIFDPFVQVRTPDRSGGTGLGLAIVRSLTVEMGGWVSVQSEVGRGSTFQILLPRHIHERIPEG